MDGLDSRELAMHCAAQMHEAAVVEGRAVFCARRQHIVQLGGEHCGRDLCVFDGKCAAKAAAAVKIVERDEVQPTDFAKQAKRAFTEMEGAHTVATGVIGDAVGKVGPHIFGAEAVDDEFTQFVHPRHEVIQLTAHLLVAEFLKQSGVLVADHGDTGRRGNDDGFRVLVKANKALGLGESFAAKAGIGVHLSATGLGRAKFDFHAQPLEEPHDRAAGLRKKRVVVAGDEERSSHDSGFNCDRGVSTRGSYSIGV